MTDFSVVSTITYSLTSTQRTITVDLTVDSAKVVDGVVTVVAPVAPAPGGMRFDTIDGVRVIVDEMGERVNI